MSIQDRITADEAAVAQAQATLDAAMAVLTQDRAVAASLQPRLDTLEKIGAMLQTVSEGMSADAVVAVDEVRTQIAELLVKLADLISN